MSEYTDLIKKMKFSFSRITSFENCPYYFYLNYIVKDPELYPNENNFYAENGSCAHQTFEALLNGEIQYEDCAEYYMNLFDNIETKTKPEIMRSTYQKTFDTFLDIDESWLDKNYEVVGVEERIDGEVMGVNFYGFLDVLLKDKRDGKYVIMDHKSAGRFFNKSGGVYSKSKKQFAEYKKQAYLYSHLVKQKYGEFPKAFIWNHFKEGCYQTYVEFDEQEYEDTLKWFGSLFTEICMEEEFNPKEFLLNDEVKSDEFYCNNLCGYRKSCEYIREFMRKRWKNK